MDSPCAKSQDEAQTWGLHLLRCWPSPWKPLEQKRGCRRPCILDKWLGWEPGLISLHGTNIKVQSVWGCRIRGGTGARGWGRPCSSLSPYGEDAGSRPQQRGHRLTLSQCGRRGGSGAPTAVGLRSGRQARQFGPRTVEGQVLGRLSALGVVAPPRSCSPSSVTLSSPSLYFLCDVLALRRHTSVDTHLSTQAHTHLIVCFLLPMPGAQDGASLTPASHQMSVTRERPASRPGFRRATFSLADDFTPAGPFVSREPCGSHLPQEIVVRVQHALAPSPAPGTQHTPPR